jgi:Protein of unknown function (DUF4232)
MVNKEGSMMNSRLRLSMPFALAAAGMVLAGCQSSSSVSGSVQSIASTAASAASAASSAAAAAGTPTAAATTGSSAGAAAISGCTAAQLKVAYTDNAQIKAGSLDGMSHVDNVVTFTNTGSASCQFGGYPGVAALDSAGKQVMQAKRMSVAGKLITLAPGAVASAMVSANTASCTTPTQVAGLLVTAPNQRTSIRLGRTITLCLSSLQVQPVVPGDSAGTATS